jgi:hypothetical protein
VGIRFRHYANYNLTFCAAESSFAIRKRNEADSESILGLFLFQVRGPIGVAQSQ